VSRLTLRETIRELQRAGTWTPAVVASGHVREGTLPSGQSPRPRHRPEAAIDLENALVMREVIAAAADARARINILLEDIPALEQNLRHGDAQTRRDRRRQRGR
jgi:hypothetical protein